MEDSVAERAGYKVQTADRLPPIHRGRKPEVAMLVCPGMTLLDVLAPQTVMFPSCNIHLVWKNTDLLETDSGVVLKPSCSFQDCPRDLDVLLVGGTPFSILEDDETLRFLADRGATAKYVTSVCGGSLVLAAAGLLRGYQATSHWAMRDALAMFEAIPVADRVVTDRNRVSGGGVTAGIDFGLVILAELLGSEIAQVTQLSMEYDPAPPFDVGTPEKAGPALVEKVQEWIGPATMETITRTLNTAASRMGSYTRT